MPKLVEPVDSNPFTRTAIPFDLNNDGVALDPVDDWNLFVVALALWSTGAQAVSDAIAASWDVAAWDVDGTHLTFPGDGVLTEADLLEIYSAFLSAQPQSSVCVPANPLWDPSVNPTCP